MKWGESSCYLITKQAKAARQSLARRSAVIDFTNEELVCTLEARGSQAIVLHLFTPQNCGGSSSLVIFLHRLQPLYCWALPLGPQLKVYIKIRPAALEGYQWFYCVFTPFTCLFFLFILFLRGIILRMIESVTWHNRTTARLRRLAWWMLISSPCCLPIAWFPFDSRSLGDWRWRYDGIRGYKARAESIS